MEGYGIESYGERLVEDYDDLWRVTMRADAVAPAVSTLAALAGALAGPPRALELAVGTDRIDLSVAVLDTVAQTIESQHVVLEHGKPVRMHPVVLRYAFPAELDLMARMAGLTLRDRWAAWDRSPFGSGSAQHISVYVKEAAWASES